MPFETKVAVVGGGVTGLCAAFYLEKAYGPDAVLLLEASDYIGGQTRTDRADGYSVDWGPNGFLDREPLTLKWAEDLGVADRLVRANDNAAHRFVLKNGRMMEVVPPPGFLLSPLLSLKGRARLCCEPLIPQKKDDEPESIWHFAARRIGPEAADTLVMPMVTGIFGGDAKRLSLEHCFPRMFNMERQYGSLLKALLAKKREKQKVSAAGPSGTLTSFPEGVGFLAHSVAARLGDRAWTNARVTGISRENGGYRIETLDGRTVRAEQVVVATPAYVAAEAVAAMDADLTRALGGIAYADIAVVCSGYSRERVGHDMNGFGFLVPPKEGMRTLGCIWTSSIFPNQAPEGTVLLRSMYGGFNDPAAAALSDAELLDYLRREVHPLLGIKTDPEFLRIFRHPRGIPQYLLGHGDLLRAIEAGEDRYPGLVFAGNAYRGVGLNDCVVSAHRAVDRLTERTRQDEQDKSGLAG
jgi:oxygen-dependent protoporphyrinogen oxidase